MVVGLVAIVCVTPSQSVIIPVMHSATVLYDGRTNPVQRHSSATAVGLVDCGLLGGFLTLYELKA